MLITVRLRILLRIRFELWGALARVHLLVVTKAAARREGKLPASSAFMSLNADTNELIRGIAPYQARLRDTLAKWLKALRAASVTYRGIQAERCIKAKRRVDRIDGEIDETRRKLHEPLQLGKLGPLTIISIAIAAILGVVLSWGFMEEQGWPAPVTALASLALTALELGAFFFVGAGVARLILDDEEIHRHFKLTRPARIATLLFTVAIGIVAIVFTIGFASPRGEGTIKLIWILAALVAAGLAVHAAMVLYETREHRRLARLQRKLERAVKRLDKHVETLRRMSDRIFSTGQVLRDRAVGVSSSADVSFARAARRASRGQEDRVMADIPRIDFPDDAQLQVMLLTDVSDVQLNLGDVYTRGGRGPSASMLNPAPETE